MYKSTGDNTGFVASPELEDQALGGLQKQHGVGFVE